MYKLIILGFVLVLYSSPCIASFIDNGDGTVTDDATGLMWEQATDSTTKTWEEALLYCEGLVLAGYTDWRPPNIKELRSLVDYGAYAPAIDAAYFPDTVSSVYWSSTTRGHQSQAALYIGFTDGDDYVYPSSNDTITKTDYYYVRAVRGGQDELPDNLVIYVPAQASTWRVGSPMSIKWDTRDIAGNVKISVSRQGGREGTFETIALSTENDGFYTWTVSGSLTVNCMLIIEPIIDPSKRAAQGLFSIVE